MSTGTKYRWIVSLSLGGILLVLAVIGGNWQTSYAADPGLNAAPAIDYIEPDRVKVGSSDTPMIIWGSDFGTSEDFIRVWIHDPINDYSVTPYNVGVNYISLVVTDTLLTSPITYTIKVVKSNGQSIPTIPPNLIYDQVSNAVNFWVYAPQYIYLPITSK
jgi:hypothetical protein